MKNQMLCCGLLAGLLTPLPALAAGGANPFAGTIYQAIATAVVFLVVLVVLKKTAWGKILQGLQDRENRIRQDLTDAEKAAAQADQTLKQYQAKLAEAQAEGGRIIDQSRADAERVAQQIREEAESQITQMRQRATNDIASAKEQAIQDLYSEMASLSTAVASRILNREVKVEDQQQLIETSLDELASKH